MRKSTAIILAIAGMLLLLGGVGLLIIGGLSKEDDWSARWSHTINVAEQKADPETSQTDFQIDKDGEYQFSLSWLPQGKTQKDIKDITSGDLGFITAVVLFNEKGEEIYATNASAITIDTTLELEKGTYTMMFHYLTDRDEYLEFAKTYLCSEAQAAQWAESLDFGSLQKSGSWPMDYAMGVSRAGGWNGRAVGLLLGILTGICVVVLLVAAYTKGSRMESPKYDERQEMERGRGFRYAFFTMLIFIGLVFTIDMTGLAWHLDLTFLYGCGFFLGILVYAVYGVWHECYFALNQKTRTVLISFAFIGIFNLVLGLDSLLSGTIIENGRLSFRVLNLMCAALFLILALTIVAKKVRDSREESDQ